MKKLIVIFGIIVSVLTAGVASAKLYDFYAEKGNRLPSIQDRQVDAYLCGIFPYDGTYEQNIDLEKCLRNEQILSGTLPVAGVNYSLAGSGITSSATSITLQSLTIPQTGYKLQDSDFSTTFYVTLEPGNQKRQEISSCTTVVQNANGTATLSGCLRGLVPFFPYTASTTYQFPHAGGTTLIFSDAPQLFNEFPAKANAETITGLFTFEQHPQSSSTLANPTSTYQYVTYGYVNNVALQGAATSSETQAGISEQATQVEMASSTQFDANNPHFISSEYATSTPYSGMTGLFALITENDGKLSQSFIRKSDDYTGTNSFTGPWNWSATTTFATSTVVSSTIDTVHTTKLIVDNIDADNLVGYNNASALHFHPYGVDTETSATWFSYSQVPSSTLGWIIDTTLVVSGTGGTFTITSPANNNTSFYTRLPGHNADTNFQFDATKGVRAKFRARTNPSSIQSFGFGTTVNDFDDNATSTIAAIRFVIIGSNVYSSSGTGAANESNTIAGITPTNWNTYEIVWDGASSAKFYVNGTLQSTHTTSLPTATASDMWFGYGTNVGGSITGSAVNFSIEG